MPVYTKKEQMKYFTDENGSSLIYVDDEENNYGQEYDYPSDEDEEEETSSIEQLIVPERFEIVNAYPNPFNPQIQIEFALPYASIIHINAYNVTGALVEKITTDYMSYGFHAIKWNANDLPSGLYFIQILSERESILSKVVLLK